MLKKYFIPVMIALLFAVVLIYYISASTSKPRDVRAAVPVERFTLRNGLTVVVMPSERLPVVTHMLVVKAGGADDPQGKSGLAHYLEHLMFTGTKNFPEGTYERAINRIGGAQNAHTLRDYTLYYATVPSANLDLVMTMEADRIANLNFTADLAARELKVITEERGIRIENSPAAQWSEQLDAMTFLNHPYGKPLIGWAEDMATFTPADAQGFFDRYYRPSNMVLVVAGDVRPRDVRRMAQRYYGGLVASDAAPRVWPSEPPMRLKRHGEMRDERVNEARVMIQFAAASARSGKTEYALPLEVMAQYLGGGDASVLYTALVREQKLATNVWSSYDSLSIGPGVFRITAIPAAGVSPDELTRAMERELARLLAGPLDASALARAKTLLSAQVIFAQDGLDEIASVMAELYALGLDEQYFYGWQQAIEAVTPEQALVAARATFVLDRSVTGVLLPNEKQAIPQLPTQDAAAPEVTHAP